MHQQDRQFAERAPDLVNVLTRVDDLETERRVLYLAELQAMVKEELAEAKVRIKAELSAMSPLGRRLRKIQHENWVKDRQKM